MTPAIAAIKRAAYIGGSLGLEEGLHKAFSLVTISRYLVVSYSDCGSFMCEHEPVEPLR
jgi:hypothetical protein